MTGIRTAVVVGNPRPRSRTLSSATYLARSLTGSDPDLVVDLATWGARLLDWHDPDVAALVAEVGSADLVVVASPTYKATYTGLLKLFLDQIGADELAGVVTVPVMVGAGAAHALAVETHLRPVLVELGATMPTRGLYLQEADLAELAPVLEAWWRPAEGPMRRLLG